MFRQLKDGEYGFCKMHDPVAVKEKRDKQNAEWNAKWEADRRQARLQELRNEALKECVTALREIAAGHNDARTLAAAALLKLDDCDKELSATSS